MTPREDLLAKIRTLQRSGHACSDAPCTICEVIRAFNRVSKSERKQALLGTCTTKNPHAVALGRKGIIP